MKLIGVMTLAQYRDRVRQLFELHQVQLYSEVEITGHSSESIQRYGWWVFEKEDIPMYATLFFAIVAREKAAAILAAIEALRPAFDPDHPPRAFQVDVEQMV